MSMQSERHGMAAEREGFEPSLCAALTRRLIAARQTPLVVPRRSISTRWRAPWSASHAAVARPKPPLTR